MSDIAATVACPQCNGPSPLLSTVTNAGTTGYVFRCQRCQHKSGRLILGPNDPDDVHRYVRRKWSAMLKPPPARPAIPASTVAPR